MDASPPVTAPVVVEQAACRPEGALKDAQEVLRKVKTSFPRTSFRDAWPSCIPGITALLLNNGTVAYTDKSARYLMLGLVLDSVTGKALDRQLDGQTE